MADHLVHGCATRSRKVVIVHRTRIAIPFQARLMNDAVQFVGGHSDRHRLGRLVQHLTAQFAGHSHALNVLVVQHLDGRVAAQTLLGQRTPLRMIRIVRTLNGRRHPANRRLGPRAEFAAVAEIRPRIIGMLVLGLGMGSICKRNSRNESLLVSM